MVQHAQQANRSRMSCQYQQNSRILTPDCRSTGHTCTSSCRSFGASSEQPFNHLKKILAGHVHNASCCSRHSRHSRVVRLLRWKRSVYFLEFKALV